MRSGPSLITGSESGSGVPSHIVVLGFSSVLQLFSETPTSGVSSSSLAVSYQSSCEVVSFRLTATGAVGIRIRVTCRATSFISPGELPRSCPTVAPTGVFIINSATSLFIAPFSTGAIVLYAG